MSAFNPARITATACGPRIITTPMLRPWDYVLTSTGRAGRRAFIACATLLVGLWALFDLATPAPVRNIAAWAVIPLFLYVGACVLSLRLHDRSRSGWWCWLILAAFAMGWPLIGAAIHGTPLDALPRWRWIGVAITGFAVAYLAILPGRREFNRFGPSPAHGSARLASVRRS